MESITRIIKRDGRTADFDVEKITEAIYKAAKVLGGKKYNGVLWKKAADGTFTPTAVSCDMGARKYPSRFDAFPIPQSEISNNTLAKQNPGW